MDRTRRALLGTVGGLATGLAGCLAAEGVEYPETGGDVGDAVETPAEVDEDAFEEDDEPANEALAAATRRVVDDAVWFATEYPDAVATYLDAVGDVVGEVEARREEVLETEETHEAAVDDLEAVGMEAADRAGDALEPHFHPRGMLRERIDRHVEVLELFAERDDADRFLEELDRMRTTFASVGTERFVETVFSRNPIDNRLLDRLLATGNGEARRTTLAEIAVASRGGFTTFAKEPYDEDTYADHEIPELYGDALRAERREEIRARLGPVVRPEDRTEELFVTFAPRPEPDPDSGPPFEGWPEELDPLAVYVQRYEDAETAAARLDDITADGRTEDTEPVDPDADRTDGDATNWHRYYHHEAAGERYEFDRHEEVQYGYVVRAGEFVLATGFSGDAWEERTVWQAELADSWITV